MWLDYFILPAIFLIASSSLYAMRLALQNAGLIASRKELTRYKKYYGLIHRIQKTPHQHHWEALFDYIRLTNQITRLIYTITALLYFLKHAEGLFNYTITHNQFEVPILWTLIFFFVILLLQLAVDFLFSLLSRAAPIKALRLFNAIASLFLLIFSPITFLVGRVTRLLKKTPIETKKESHEHVRDKLLEFVQETEIQSLLSPNDRKLLISVASFQERTVREAMVPRIDVFSIEASQTIEMCIEELIEEGYSRVPVYEGDIDHIIGILLVKDLLSFYASHNQSKEMLASTTIKQFIKPAIFTPETKKISHLLQEFRSRQFHLAIVVDEYGGTEGIITIEDILEELVGDIEDEYDEGEEKLYLSQPDGGWIIDGKMSIIDIEEKLSIAIPPSSEYETIGGYIFQRAGSIPKKGWRLHHDHFYIEVLQSDEKSIEKVKVIPTLYEHPEEDNNSI